MKKIVAIAVVLGLAGGAQAASVGFDFGVNWVNWNDNAAAGVAESTQQGRNFLLSWNLDNDISLGVYNEVISDSGGTPSVLNAIQVGKGVVKNVKVGFNLGSLDLLSAGAPQAVADVFGEVTILSGAGDKVSGALKAVVASRFSNSAVNADATNLGLEVGIAF